MRTTVTFHVSGIILVVAGSWIIGIAGAYYNPPQILQFVCAVLFGIVSVKLFPMASVRRS